MESLTRRELLATGVFFVGNYVQKPQSIIDSGIRHIPFPLNWTEQSVELVDLDNRVITKPINDRNTAIVIHGMNNTAANTKLLAQYLLGAGCFTNVLQLRYPWGNDITETAGQFCALVKRLFKPNASVMLITHSMGGLIASWAVEQLGLADYVRAMLCIAIPRRGVNKAKLASVATGTNQPNQGKPGNTFADLNTMSVRQINPDSTFLRKLNDTPYRRSNRVPYGLIAGTNNDWEYGLGALNAIGVNDGLVTKESMLNFDYSTHATLGSITITTGFYNHSALITNQHALAMVVKTVRKLQGTLEPQVTLAADHNAIAGDLGWETTLTITNPLTGLTMIIERVALQSFNSNRFLVDTQWFDASVTKGIRHPDTSHWFGLALASRQTYTARLHADFGRKKQLYSKVSPLLHAQSVLCVCSGHIAETGEQFTVTEPLLLLDKSGHGPAVPVVVAHR